MMEGGRVLGKRLPVSIQTDNGSEFISKSLDKWAYEHGVTMDFSRPGKPTDNPFIESLNGSLRDECLNIHWFLSLEDAQDKLDNWRREYDRGNNAGLTGLRGLLHSSSGLMGAKLQNFFWRRGLSCLEGYFKD